MSDLLAAALPLIGLFFIYRLILGKRSGGFISPTGMLRGATGPFRFSPRSPFALWSHYALAMVLATQLVSDTAEIAERVGTTAAGDPTTRAVITLLLVVACALAAIAAIPGGIGNHTLELVAVGASILLALVDPWIGTWVLAIVAVMGLCYRGLLGEIFAWGAVLLAYLVLYSEKGSDDVTLAIVMTVLMGTLTMLLIVATRTISIGIVLIVLFGVAIVSGLTLAV
jgi:hypothetical protein